MKKTACIQLVLITAALAACNKPLYQQDPVYYEGDAPDSTNSCPIADPYLYAYQPDYFNWISAFRYYPYRSPHPIIVRAGFGHRPAKAGS
ncbi:MAG: hypothetical protein JST68_21805 [Bacteroidetes bacterium]|nr:hypothetical protein [Bacteroidota bacterium]